MLCINQKLNTLARQIVEAYLPTIPEGMLIHLQAAAGVSQKNSTTTQGQKDPLMTNYERLVELYLIHVLAKLSEWDFATEFLQYNNVLSDSSKKTYGKILDKLHQKSLRPKKAVSTKKLQHQSTAVDPPNFGSKSTSTVTSPTIASTSVSSPTLSSASTLSSPETSHTLEPQIGSSSNASKPGAESGPGVVSTKKSSSAASSGSLNNTRTTIAVSKKDSSAVTLRGRALLFLQHYVKLIRQASGQMGTNQLMIVVGLVVFMGALSRNRTRASKYLKAGMAKVMDTVKMGTTVTSI
ncbi:hypothetical protein EDD21DRAFT_149052 [Dissophora ornata]|nr:hypothetical protein EDD21DRAFT_149052 [Dissophora ornata]